MQLNPLHLSVAKLLEGRLFRIPEYQRAYSWQSRQREDLFNDIEESHRSGREHFMATLVALAREKRVIAADELQTVELVDGQQRVTTLVILLKAIEKALDGELQAERKSKRDLDDLLVKGDDHSLVLLQTNHDSSNIFLNYLRKGTLDTSAMVTASDQNLVDAITECEKFVARWQNEGALVLLLGTIRNKLSMIYHEVADEATVYRVFEVLNSRGLAVKWIDKTKSQLMASIFEYVEEGSRLEGLKEMQTVWQDIFRILGLRQNLGNEALRFAGTWSCGSRPNRIYGEEEASVELIRRAGRKLPSIIETAEWLRRVVRVANLLNGDVRRAAVTKIAHARFLAVGILLREFKADVQEELLAAWERVTFRIFGLGGADTRHKVGEYVRLGYEVVTQQLTADDIRAGIKRLGDGFNISEVLNHKDFWDESYNGWTEELRYLLFRYDEHLAREAGEQINTAQWTKIWAMDPSKSIEHIMPQSAERSYVHHLGNLTMLPPGVNSSLQDTPPKKKAARYIECGIKGTVSVGRIIENSDSWTEKDVRNRAARIESFIRQEWSD